MPSPLKRGSCNIDMQDITRVPDFQIDKDVHILLFNDSFARGATCSALDLLCPSSNRDTEGRMSWKIHDLFESKISRCTQVCQPQLA